MSAPPSNFDPIARAYRWLEYLTFGRALERCRLHFVPALDKCRKALLLGDGDGRFVAHLMARYPELNVDAVDSSAAMINVLQVRCETKTPGATTRLRCHRADAVAFVEDLPEDTYDLIVTHFFLDCLSQADVEALTTAIAKGAIPGAIWIVSDFCIAGDWMKLPSQIVVRSLYIAFGVLTRLRTRTLPDHAAALTKAGFMRKATRFSLGGLLFTECWTLPDD